MRKPLSLTTRSWPDSPCVMPTQLFILSPPVLGNPYSSWDSRCLCTSTHTTHLEVSGFNTHGATLWPVGDRSWRRNSCPPDEYTDLRCLPSLSEESDGRLSSWLLFMTAWYAPYPTCYHSFPDSFSFSLILTFLGSVLTNKMLAYNRLPWLLFS